MHPVKDGQEQSCSIVLSVCSDPSCGGETIYSTGFFCLDNFGRSIDSSWRVMSDIIQKSIQRRVWNNKDFFEFRFLESIIEV